ncbi:MAG: hypothetical protein V5A62_02880 [Haloarculaceae archaeon]
MSTPTLPEAFREELVSAARTVVGDELRSVTYFTEDDVEQVYLRGDLDPEADLVGFADVERLGFHSRMDYRGTELGSYRFTIRVFDHGYLTRVIAGDHGVFVTTDPMVRDRFEELATALRETLRGADVVTG